jgi:hypothetical protein
MLASLFLAVCVWLTATGTTAYLYALHLESRWTKADPKTKEVLEKYLNCYTLREIQPTDSRWGIHYELKAGERMLQYSILWNRNCPLDVVYDTNDAIRAIFTSYE